MQAAIDALNPIVALLSLIHITGDQTLLHRYGPHLEGAQEQKREAFATLQKIEQKTGDPNIVTEIWTLLLVRAFLFRASRT